MIHLETLRTYCLSKKGVTEEFPFDEDTLVFKVMGKMFALLSLAKWENGEKTINLKCEPGYAVELRDNYTGIVAGYHMNKQHWNTVDTSSGEWQPGFLISLIDHSYELVVAKLPKRLKDLLAAS